MANLIIDNIRTDQGITISCSGRLDANHAGHLSDYIGKLVREGEYHLALDLTGVEYLSSAGIRTLVSQYKSLKSVNGVFYVAALSEAVRQVLSLVGMEEMLCTLPEKTTVSEVDSSEITPESHPDMHFELLARTASSGTVLQLYGNPEQLQHGDFKDSHSRRHDAASGHFALGLGAIGDSFEDCRSRFGEYLIAGSNVAYLPADGSRKPDYMQSSGKLQASIVELYGLSFEEKHSMMLRFAPKKTGCSIALSELLSHLSTQAKCGDFALVMVAESGGLVGSSLNASPVETTDIFHYPELKQRVNFSTEPVHQRLLTLSVGVFTSRTPDVLRPFVRPLSVDSESQGHFHSLVFPYLPLKKTHLQLDDLLGQLFDESELIDLMHLLNDQRDISGSGESRFVQGFCWITPIESIVNTKNS